MRNIYVVLENVLVSGQNQQNLEEKRTTTFTFVMTLTHINLCLLVD